MIRFHIGFRNEVLADICIGSRQKKNNKKKRPLLLVRIEPIGAKAN